MNDLIGRFETLQAARSSMVRFIGPSLLIATALVQSVQSGWSSHSPAEPAHVAPQNWSLLPPEGTTLPAGARSHTAHLRASCVLIRMEGLTVTSPSAATRAPNLCHGGGWLVWCVFRPDFEDEVTASGLVNSPLLRNLCRTNRLKVMSLNRCAAQGSRQCAGGIHFSKTLFSLYSRPLSNVGGRTAPLPGLNCKRIHIVLTRRLPLKAPLARERAGRRALQAVWRRRFPS